MEQFIIGAAGASLASIIGAFVMYWFNSKHRIEDQKARFRRAQFALISLHNNIHSSYSEYFQDVVNGTKKGSHLGPYTYNDIADDFKLTDLDALIEGAQAKRTLVDYSTAYELAGVIAQQYKLCLSILDERNKKYEILQSIPHHSPPTREMIELYETIDLMTDTFISFSGRFIERSARLSHIINKAYQQLFIEKPLTFTDNREDALSVDDLLSRLESDAGI